MTRQAERGVILRQLLRYGLVGLGSNLVLYLAYLLLTGLGTGPKLAMTLLYLLGVSQTFVFNKKWTFSHHGRSSAALLRYVSAYALGYVLNWIALYVFVDRLLYSHAVVQAVMVLCLAALLFALQRYWVFKVANVAGVSKA